MFVRVSPNRLLLAGKEIYKDKLKTRNTKFPRQLMLQRRSKMIYHQKSLEGIRGTTLIQA